MASETVRGASVGSCANTARLVARASRRPRRLENDAAAAGAVEHLQRLIEADREIAVADRRRRRERADQRNEFVEPRRFFGATEARAARARAFARDRRNRVLGVAARV